jgi:hypothetical protein
MPVHQRQFREIQQRVIRQPHRQPVFKFHFRESAPRLQIKSFLDRKVYSRRLPFLSRAAVLHFSLHETQPHDPNIAVVFSLCRQSCRKQNSGH